MRFALRISASGCHFTSNAAFCYEAHRGLCKLAFWRLPLYRQFRIRGIRMQCGGGGGMLAVISDSACLAGGVYWMTVICENCLHFIASSCWWLGDSVGRIEPQRLNRLTYSILHIHVGHRQDLIHLNNALDIIYIFLIWCLMSQVDLLL